MGTQVATGWVAGLPEQARGTALAVPNQNPLANPAVSAVTAPSTVNQVTGTAESVITQSDVSVNATGSHAASSADPSAVNGWSANMPSTVNQPTTVGWPMGLSEQARGTAQATVTGVAGPIPVQPQIPDIISQQPAFIVPGLGAANFVQAAVPGGNGVGRPKNLLKLLPYNGEESLETFLAKFDYMAEYLKWKETCLLYTSPSPRD